MTDAKSAEGPSDAGNSGSSGEEKASLSNSSSTKTEAAPSESLVLNPESATNAPAAAADSSSAPTEPPEASKGGIENRRSRWASSASALGFVLRLGRDRQIHFRNSDKTTTELMAAAVLCLIALIVVPVFIVPMAIACDVLFGLALMYYISNRLGIIETLQPRVAALVCELMAGLCLLCVFLLINAEVLIAFFRDLALANAN